MFNNNPSTFNIITKSALIGIIGAVIGMKRDEAKQIDFYKNVSANLFYSVKLNTPFKKGFWNEYSLNFMNMINKQSDATRPLRSPKNSERLYNIDYEIFIMYNENINIFIENFIQNIKNKQSVFTPYLGMANMFCDINFKNTHLYKEENGIFETESFVTNLIDKSDDITYYNNIYTDNMPTLCNSLFVHDFDKYKQIYFNGSGKNELINGEGLFYKIEDGRCIEFI